MDGSEKIPWLPIAGVGVALFLVYKIIGKLKSGGGILGSAKDILVGAPEPEVERVNRYSVSGRPFPTLKNLGRVWGKIDRPTTGSIVERAKLFSDQFPISARVENWSTEPRRVDLVFDVFDDFSLQSDGSRQTDFPSIQLAPSEGVSIDGFLKVGKSNIFPGSPKVALRMYWDGHLLDKVNVTRT